MPKKQAIHDGYGTTKQEEGRGLKGTRGIALENCSQSQDSTIPPLQRGELGAKANNSSLQKITAAQLQVARQGVPRPLPLVGSRGASLANKQAQKQIRLRV